MGVRTSSFQFQALMAFSLLLAGCSGMTGSSMSGAHRAKLCNLSEKDMVLHVPAKNGECPASLVEFFKTNSVMVTTLDQYDVDVEEGAFWVIYPSVNRGPSPMYSHKVKINIREDFPTSLERILNAHQMAILLATDERFTWDLVGYDSSPDRDEFPDWFSGHPLLRYDLRLLGDRVQKNAL